MPPVKLQNTKYGHHRSDPEEPKPETKTEPSKTDLPWNDEPEEVYDIRGEHRLAGDGLDGE